jgi:hypothetical protein
MYRFYEFDRDRLALKTAAEFAYRVASPILELRAPARKLQEAVADLLMSAFLHSEMNLLISRDFLVHEVCLKDCDLLSTWESTPKNIAWLMVHEDLSAYFTRYAIRYWEPEIFLVHHVPKSAGTSLNALLNEQLWFVTYPQTTFEVMCQSYGILGFASQLVMFETLYQKDRIYVGGHYNLPETVANLAISPDCHGVSLCRPPRAIVSSAIRYIWTRIENGDDDLASLYGLDGIDAMELHKLRSETDLDDKFIKAISEICRSISVSSQFRSEYEEIYVKYFYNNSVNKPKILNEYLRSLKNFVISLDFFRDKSKVLSALKISGSVKRTNVSLLSEEALHLSFGGKEKFINFADSLMPESQKIYELLCEISGGGCKR